MPNSTQMRRRVFQPPFLPDACYAAVVIDRTGIIRKRLLVTRYRSSYREIGQVRNCYRPRAVVGAILLSLIKGCPDPALLRHWGRGWYLEDRGAHARLPSS